MVYERAGFNSKLTGCDAENGETQTWLEFSFSCDNIKNKLFKA